RPAETTTYIVSSVTPGCDRRKEDSIIVMRRELPEITIMNDTLICSIDTLQLQSSSVTAVSYQWGPDYHISNLNISSPLVSPDVPAQYILKVTDQFGCINYDTVKVDVKQFVTI